MTLGTGTATSRYLVAVTGRTPAEGLVTRWQKPDGTLYSLSYRDRGRCSCDCPACCWEAVTRADRRHRDTFGTLGCGKLDALAALAAAGTLTAG